MSRKPTLVRFARGHVADWSWKRLAQIMANVKYDPELRDHKGRILEALAATAGELQVRFRQYERWPTRVVLMSRRFNPTGHEVEARSFLSADDEHLDYGYSLRLRDKALSAGGGDTDQALLFLLDPCVQAEIDAIALHVEGSSLDVERKHRLDKMCERSKVVGVAAASRNSIIRQWRRDAALARVPTGCLKAQGHVKNQRRAQFINLRSLALQHAPELFPRGRGKLWWDNTVSSKARRSNDKTANDELVRAQDDYILKNMGWLQAQLAEIKSAGRGHDEGGVTAGGAPLSKADWMKWFQNAANEATFREHAQKSRNGSRKVHDERLVAQDGMPHKAHSLQTALVARAFSWWQHMESGVYSFMEERGAEPRRMVILLISVAWQHWAVELHLTEDNTSWVFPLHGIDLKPLRQVLPG